MRPLERNGRVLRCDGIDRIVVQGLDDAALGELVTVEDTRSPAIVTALRDGGIVELVPLSARPVRAGSWVVSAGRLAAAVGDALVGRVVDCLGRPFDESGTPSHIGPANRETHPLFFRDPYVVPLTDRRLTFGLLGIDLMQVVPCGSSRAIRGDDHVTAHVLAHQLHAGRLVIDARVRLPARHAGSVPPDTIRIAVGDAPAPAQHWLVPFAAMAMASAFRAHGRDVAVVLDGVDAWKAHAKRFVDRGAWHTQLAQLASHAYATATGSVSLLARVRDVTPATVAAFDGYLDLNNVARGVPSLRGGFVRPVVRVEPIGVLGRVCGHANALAELEASAGWALDDDQLDRSTRELVRGGRRARTVLRFRRGATLDSLEQILCVHAVERHRLIDDASIPRFCDAFVAAVRDEHADLLAAIRKAGRATTSELEQLLAVAKPIALEIESSFS